LDVARRQYSETIEDVHSLVKELQDTTGISSLKLKHSLNRGYYLVMDSKEKPPNVFIQVMKKKNSLHCSTENLISFNFKIKELLEEIFLLTEKYSLLSFEFFRILQDLLKFIRERIPSLYKISESISILDLLLSFATLVTISNTGDYVRPEFTEDGPIAIKNGRDPVMEKKMESGFFIPVFSNTTL
jgi:DNA mismatch repair protein MSH4